jgi:hypothetical protein
LFIIVGCDGFFVDGERERFGECKTGKTRIEKDFLMKRLSFFWQNRNCSNTKMYQQFFSFAFHHTKVKTKNKRSSNNLPLTKEENQSKNTLELSQLYWKK